MSQQLPLAGKITARARGSSLAVQIEEATAAGAQLRGELNTAAGGALSGTLTLSASNLLDVLTSLAAAGFVPASLRGMQLRGPITAQVTLSSTASQPTAKFVAQSEALTAAPGVTGRMDLSGVVDAQHLAVEQLRLQAPHSLFAAPCRIRRCSKRSAPPGKRIRWQGSTVLCK